MGAAKPRKLKPAIAFMVVVMGAIAVGAVALSRPARSMLPVRPAPVAITVAINGKVVKLDVHDGEIVQKGQILAELDSTGYEADLKKAEAELVQVQGKGQAAIQPMEGVPGIVGSLPAQMPMHFSVPPTPRVEPKPEPKAEVAPKPPVAKPKVVDNGYQKALDKEQSARNALDKSTQALAKSSTELMDAQKARDALRPKMIQADVAASQAAKKADGAKDLLDAGVISTKRSEELAADKIATQKALDALKSQIASADQAIADAQSTQKAAQDALDKATLALKGSDDQLAKANEAPAAVLVPQPPVGVAKPPVAAEHVPETHPAHSKESHTSAQVMMRPKALRVHVEEAPAIPVKVFVDQKAMQNSEVQTQTIQKQIDALKARITECKVVAPVAGRVSISASGVISIQPL